MDLIHHGEGHLVLAGAEGLDLIIASGLLCSEVIAGEAENHQTLSGMISVEFFQGCVLRSISTMGGHINDQDYLFCILAQGSLFPVHSTK